MYQIYPEVNNNTQINLSSPDQAHRNQWNSFSEYLKSEDKETTESAKPLGQMFPQHDKISFDL